MIVPSRSAVVRTLLLTLMVVALAAGREFGQSASAQSEPGSTVATHHETVPNPVHNSSVRVSADCRSAICDWDNPATWQAGSVPDAGSRVIIDGRVRIANGDANARSVGIYPGGTLSFATDANTRLRTADLVVFSGGTLEIGTTNSPISPANTAEVVFRDVAFDSNDPEQHLRGLVALDGTVRIAGRTLSETFLRTSSEPGQGDRTISLERSAIDAGWRVGDAVVVPTSRQCPYADLNYRGLQCPEETEDHTISAISPDGLTVTLEDALAFDHPGARDASGSLDLTPHLINKSRNVVLRSENPQGVRAHTLFHGRADIDIRHASLISMGRTDIRNLGPSNQKGRYPLHAHHLIGPSTAQGNGYQYTMIGNVVDFGAENDTQDRKWGIALHGSHFGLVQRNVVDYSSGAGIVTESGAETGNVLDANFVVRLIGGNGERLEDLNPGPDDRSKLGRSGTGFWFNGGGGNTVTNNVVAAVSDCSGYAPSPTPGGDRPVYCYAFKYDNVRNGELVFPTSQGDDPYMGGGETVDSFSIGINDFFGNEAYAVPNGMTVWWVCSNWINPVDECSSRLDSLTLWHHHRWGFFGYPVNNLTLDNFVVRGDPSALANRYASVVGFEFADYFSRRVSVRNADVQNVSVGVNMPTFNDVRGASGPDVGFMLVEDSYFAATEGANIYAPSNVNFQDDLPPQTSVFRNVRFDYPAVDLGDRSHGHINMKDIAPVGMGDNIMNRTVRNDVWVYNYNQAPGVDGDDLYIVPGYHGPGRCDDALGSCSTESTGTYSNIKMGHVFPLRDVQPPFDPPPPTTSTTAPPTTVPPTTSTSAPPTTAAPTTSTSTTVPPTTAPPTTPTTAPPTTPTTTAPTTTPPTTVSPPPPPPVGGNLIRNGSFDSTATPPWGTWSADNTDHMVVTNGQLFVGHYGPGAVLYQAFGAINVGETYRLRVDIRADRRAAPVEIYLQQTNSPYRAVSDVHNLVAGFQQQTIDYTFTATTDSESTGLLFGFGQSSPSIWIDNVSLELVSD